MCTDFHNNNGLNLNLLLYLTTKLSKYFFTNVYFVPDYVVSGFLLGSIYASVSCPVVMPLVIKHGYNASGKVNWPQLICTAGGLDTALSVGTFGLIFSFMFYETHDSYRYVKVSS